MKLIVNGQPLDVAAGTLAGLMAELGYDGPWFATALNSEVVPGEEREATSLKDGDRIEILSPMQGG